MQIINRLFFYFDFLFKVKKKKGGDMCVYILFIISVLPTLLTKSIQLSVSPF